MALDLDTALKHEAEIYAHPTIEVPIDYLKQYGNLVNAISAHLARASEILQLHGLVFDVYSPSMVNGNPDNNDYFVQVSVLGINSSESALFGSVTYEPNVDSKSQLEFRNYDMFNQIPELGGLKNISNSELLTLFGLVTYHILNKE